MQVGVAVCPQTKIIYIADAARHGIFRRTPDGAVSLCCGPPDGKEGCPRGGREQEIAAAEKGEAVACV